jgi:Flp pilus assembly protein TadD/peroxiredoxin
LRKSVHKNRSPSRRELLKALGLAPLILRPASFSGLSLFGPSGHPSLGLLPDPKSDLSITDYRLTPRYPSKSPLADVLRLVTPGLDEFVTEKYAFEIDLLLKEWAHALAASKDGHTAVPPFLAPHCVVTNFAEASEKMLREGSAVTARKRKFSKNSVEGAKQGSSQTDQAFKSWIGPFSSIEIAEFEITGMEQISANPLSLNVQIRYDIVLLRQGNPIPQREERIGVWQTTWRGDGVTGWTAERWVADEELLTSASGPGFVDITADAMAGVASFPEQLQHGVDYWRTLLDGSCGIDVYGNNGIAAGDYDGDGFDDFYVCQPAGLPNRLYRNQGDGTFEDVTEKAGVGVLGGTACALFADFDNRGTQDLLIVCGSGPLLFRNQGDGTFQQKKDAFQFARLPEGTFTHAALADYDLDGRLDIYFCTYSYYLGLDQYHYPVPYYDARNGPANYLMHNNGDGTFSDQTEAAGLNVDNDRYSFACAWGDCESKGLPDLYVANDFGRSNFYRNNGKGHFSVASANSHVEVPGAGMSAAWSDTDNDGKPDIYVANMWSSAGQRVSQQSLFQQNASEEIRALYKHHARGNSLYRNQGNGAFRNVSTEAGVEMGRWSWCSDFFDFDHDGYPDLYVANGYITAPEKKQTHSYDLGSFFWRQVVGRSPEDSTPSLAYEHGWNALNELIRSDQSWSGRERNVLFANNRDGTFSEVSGAVGLDLPEDSRSFALADIDHDGRLEILLKNRNAPQLRILRNNMQDLGNSILFRLQGTKSNRDAIGTSVTVEAGPLKQTRYLQAGSGFLAQHSKELFFGLGKPASIHATVLWPSGLSQRFENLPSNHRIKITEGSNTFTAEPFATKSFATSGLKAQSKPEQLPEQVGTWLIEPLKAPTFSLPDQSGKLQSLESTRGSFTLLTLWATRSASSIVQLRTLHRERAVLPPNQLRVVAINVDDATNREEANSFAAKESFFFPILFSTDEIAGIYNIIYRYLFDRRRDLGLPTSFLLDKDGMIVKLYQGPIDLKHLREDLRTVPATARERLERALPFHGTLHHGSFERNDFTYGVAMFQHGYLDQAAASFEHVVASKPNDPEAYYNLGTLSLRRNKFDEAHTYLQKTLELKPNYPEAWNNLGMMAAQQGRPDEAIQNFQKSLQLRPDYAIALLNLGNLYRRQGSYSKSQDNLSKALALQPDDPEINYSLGMLNAQQQQMPLAEKYLQRAIDLRPEYPEALNNLGIIYVRQNDLPKAEQQFKTGIAVAPQFDQSYLNLARLYTMRDDKPKAREVLQQLLQLQPANTTAKQAIELLK